MCETMGFDPQHQDRGIPFLQIRKRQSMQHEKSHEYQSQISKPGLLNSGIHVFLITGQQKRSCPALLLATLKTQPSLLV